MQFCVSERMAIFIDGVELFAMSRALAIDIDYGRLLTYFRLRSRLIRASYYTAIRDDVDYSPLRPLIDWLDFNGFSTVTKALKGSNSAERLNGKGRMDVDLAVDAMRLAPRLDHLVIFSGNEDLSYLVDALQQIGKRVTVVSTLKSQGPLVGDELRRQADQFLDLADIASDIKRVSSERKKLRVV